MIDPLDAIESWRLNFRLGRTIEAIVQAPRGAHGEALLALIEARRYLDKEIEVETRRAEDLTGGVKKYCPVFRCGQALRSCQPVDPCAGIRASVTYECGHGFSGAALQEVYETREPRGGA